MFADDESERLRLMHHCTLHTAQGIRTSAQRSQWAVNLAFTNEFLLPKILSIGAFANHAVVLRGVGDTVLTRH